MVEQVFRLGGVSKSLRLTLSNLVEAEPGPEARSSLLWVHSSVFTLGGAKLKPPWAASFPLNNCGVAGSQVTAVLVPGGGWEAR